MVYIEVSYNVIVVIKKMKIRGTWVPAPGSEADGGCLGALGFVALETRLLGDWERHRTAGAGPGPLGNRRKMAMVINSKINGSFMGFIADL